MSDEEYGEDSFDEAHRPPSPMKPPKGGGAKSLSDAELGELEELQEHNEALLQRVRYYEEKERVVKEEQQDTIDDMQGKIEQLKHQLKVAKENDSVTKERDKLRLL
jgi:TolA-binding protein